MYDKQIQVGDDDVPRLAVNEIPDDEPSFPIATPVKKVFIIELTVAIIMIIESSCKNRS